MSRSLTLKQKFAFSFLTLLLSFLALEFGISTFNWAANPVWETFSDAQCGVEFCPIRGMKFPAYPNRKITIRKRETLMATDDWGNNEGYPSAHDFSPERRSQFNKRVLVLGDSFTAGTYLQTNWPTRWETRQQRKGNPIEVLNFSQGGIGLANWWSIITRLVEPQKYEFDAIIFAVFGNDLRRCFFMGDGVSYGYARNWDCQSWPRNVAQARRQIAPVATSLSPTRFEYVSEHGPDLRDMPFRFIVCESLIRSVHRLNPIKPVFSADQSTGFDRHRAPLVEDIRKFVRNRQVPVLVVFLPTKERAMGLRDDSTYRDETEIFAKQIGAGFLDATEMFAGMPLQEIREHWFTHDPHWNQKGSDRFVEYLESRPSIWTLPQVAQRGR